MALRKAKQPVITNSKGEPIKLTASEREEAQYWEHWINKRFYNRLRNSLGYEVSITTLTTIVKKVSEQKLYQIAPADYVPIRVGEGTWSSNLTTYRSFDEADVFESGIIDTGASNARLSVVDAAIDALNIKVYPWAKQNGWTIFDIELASKSGNWDLIAAKEKARKRNWDLGIQRIAFLGAKGLNGSSGTVLGLLNQAGVKVDTTTITANLSGLSADNLSTFQQNVIANYRSNCNYTAFPTHFIVPESDYDGLASQASSSFPMKSKLELLLAGFQTICQNKNFKILPLAYADSANAGGALNSAYSSKQYVLLNYDEESLRMDIPLDYTNTLANSVDNFMFQNVGYGQFTGLLAYRPAEMYYMGF